MIQSASLHLSLCIPAFAKGGKMKRKLVAIWLVVCMTFTLCACTSTDKPQTDSESGEVVIPKTEETTETADQLQIVELTDVDPIAVQEIPIYEDITLKNNEVNMTDVWTGCNM